MITETDGLSLGMGIGLFQVAHSLETKFLVKLVNINEPPG